MSTDSTPAAAVVWRKDASRTLQWRDWGADSVVFDEYSGQTHRFAPLAAAVMACLEEQPLSEDELARLIADDLGTDADNELREALKAIVEQFQRLGWLVANGVA